MPSSAVEPLIKFWNNVHTSKCVTPSCRIVCLAVCCCITSELMGHSSPYGWLWYDTINEQLSRIVMSVLSVKFTYEIIAITTDTICKSRRSINMYWNNTLTFLTSIFPHTFTRRQCCRCFQSVLCASVRSNCFSLTWRRLEHWASFTEPPAASGVSPPTSGIVHRVLT